MDATVTIPHDGRMDPALSSARATYWDIIPINSGILSPGITVQPGITIQPGIAIAPGIAIEPGITI